MTLASSGALTATQIQTELGLGSFDMNRTAERNLAGRPSGAVSWSDFNGQTSGGSCTELSTDTGSTVSGVATIAITSFGATAWNRRLFFAVHWACTVNAVATTIASFTVAGGTDARIHHQSGYGGTSSSTNYGQAIISALVPAGASGNLVLTFSNATARNVLVTAYRVTGLVSPAAHNSAGAFDEVIGGGSYSAQALLDVPTGWLAFFAATGSSDGTHGAMATTGITEQQENSLATDGRTSSGFQTGPTAQNNRPVTTSWSSSTTGRLRLSTASFQIK